MAIEFRNFDRSCGCRMHAVDLDADGNIGASVGQGGRNVSKDTRTVQALLNGIGPLEGGPPEMLAVDGIVGPKTIHCIRRFQLAQIGWHDGRVDPGGQTIKLLRAPGPGGVARVAAGGAFGGSSGGGLSAGAGRAVAAATGAKDPLPAPPNMANRAALYATRILRAQVAFPDAKTSVTTAMSWLNNAIRWAQSPNLQQRNPYVAFVHKHFATGTKHSKSLTGDLFSILHVFRQIDFVMDARLGAFGGSPWGSNIFDIDRYPNLNRSAAAYTGHGAVGIPSNRVDRRYNHPMMGGTVYLCDGIDTMTNDFIISTVAHEIAHMVGDKNPATGIADHGYSFQHGRYNALGKYHRQHNAENYCMFAFEAAFGTSRAYAISSNNQAMLIAPVVINGVLND